MTLSWTQPCCLTCWTRENPENSSHSHRIHDSYAVFETCVHCGNPTRSGLYVRIDPAEANHPTRQKS